MATQQVTDLVNDNFEMLQQVNTPTQWTSYNRFYCFQTNRNDNETM